MKRSSAPNAAPPKSPSKQVRSSSVPTKSSDPLAAIGGLPFNVAVIAIAVAVIAAGNAPALTAMLPPAATNKPYATFQEFFPFYMAEHSNSVNRGLHFIGTSLVCLVALAYPMTILAIITAGEYTSW
jgi:hypothetical protein